MKFQTTQRAIKGSFSHVIRIGYCDLQSLLCFESPIAYTVRREGWASDIYAFGSAAISTGYQPFGAVKPDYRLIRAYEKRAEQITGDYNLSYAERKQALSELIYAFIEEVTQ